jgi:hypothetical protein
MDPNERQSQLRYYALAGLLMGLGLLTMLSFGAPLLLIGLVLVVLGPARVKPRIFWPMLAAVICFFVGFLPIGAASCSMTSASAHTICTNLVGMRFAGSNQPLLLGVAAGLVAGVAGAVGTRARITAR